MVFQLLHTVFVGMEVGQRRRRLNNSHQLMDRRLRGRFTFGLWGILQPLRSSPVRVRVCGMCRDDENLLLWFLGGEDEWT